MPLRRAPSVMSLPEGMRANPLRIVDRFSHNVLPKNQPVAIHGMHSKIATPPAFRYEFPMNRQSQIYSSPSGTYRQKTRGRFCPLLGDQPPPFFLAIPIERSRPASAPAVRSTLGVVATRGSSGRGYGEPVQPDMELRKSKSIWLKPAAIPRHLHRQGVIHTFLQDVLLRHIHLTPPGS